MSIELLIEAIESIKESADELKRKKNRDEVEYGELLAFAESLSIIKGAFAGYDLEKLGLDFDIDAKYL